jgi:hypothetical protein
MNLETVFSKEFLLEGFMQAPVAMAIFDADDYTVRLANQQYLQMVDRSESELIGRPLFEVFPESASGKPLLDDVLKTGKPFCGSEVETHIRRQGRTERASFNISYQPLQGKNGSIEGVMVVATDVTHLVQSKRNLQESEEKFRMMVSQSPIAMAILRGPDWTIELANEVILKNFWARDWQAIKGKKLFEVFPELKGTAYEELLTKAHYTGISQNEKELPAIINNSPSAFVDLDCGPLFNSDRSVSAMLLTVYDVSEKVRTRRKTEENEARLRMVIDASGLGTWDLNLKTGEFNYSEKYLASFGISERLTHEQLIEFMHPEDLALRKKAFQEAVRTGWLHYVSRLIWRDESIHWIEAHGKVLYDHDGEAVKMIGTSRDITEEKLYQQSIQESEEKFRLLAGTVPQLIWTGDANGNLNYFNQSVFDYSGMTLEQLQGQGWLNIVHPEDRATNLRKWKEAVNSGSNFLFEHRFRRYDGLYRWQLSRAMPQFDSTGKVQMWVGTSTDIHDQKTFAKELEEKVHERTKELKQTNEVLEKTNRELEQFAYIASHDLQEPLRKIQTFADLVKRNIHDEVSVQKYFSKIDSSAQRMGDLIRSVLEYSRIPAHPGQLILTDLNEIVDHVKSDLELTILEKDAIVERNHLPAIPGVRLQIQQLFANLIGNSLKFCKSSPCIRIIGKAVPGHALTELFKADIDKQYVELRFSDNGIGFDSRYKEQIFTIFQRLHGWQQYSGTGIGLALCKKIVENHQGFITAESMPGKGSTFTVYLPS